MSLFRFFGADGSGKSVALGDLFRFLVPIGKKEGINIAFTMASLSDDSYQVVYHAKDNCYVVRPLQYAASTDPNNRYSLVDDIFAGVPTNTIHLCDFPDFQRGSGKPYEVLSELSSSIDNANKRAIAAQADGVNDNGDDMNIFTLTTSSTPSQFQCQYPPSPKPRPDKKSLRLSKTIAV